MPNRFNAFALLAYISAPIIGIHSMKSYAEEESVKVIEPKKKVSPAQSAAIDTEKVQAGLFFGLLAVEDFNSNTVSGLSINYHINDIFIAQANFGSSKTSRATFEDVLGENYLSSSQRNFQYINLLGGYKLFTARSFWGRKHKYDSDIYLLAGLGTIDFAGSSNTSLTWGASYRVVFTDWLVSNLDIRNHMVKRDFLDDDKLTQNIEFAIGFNALF